jgi:hypothetical protein
MTGSAFSCFERTWMKWMSRPSRLDHAPMAIHQPKGSTLPVASADTKV